MMHNVHSSMMEYEVGVYVYTGICRIRTPIDPHVREFRDPGKALVYALHLRLLGLTVHPEAFHKLHAYKELGRFAPLVTANRS